MRATIATVLAFLALAASPATSQTPARDPVGDLCASHAGIALPTTQVYHRRNGATIVFVAVEHEHDAQSPSAQAIKAAFDRFHPTLVLVEGASADKSADPAYRAFLSQRAADQLAQGHIQENLYAVKLATDAKTAFSGWDLSPRDEYRVDIDAGYDVGNALGAHLLRAHVDPFGPVPADRLAEEVRSIPHLRQPQDFDFAAWYRGAYGPRLDLMAGTPCGTGPASAIVKFESIARTRNLVRLIDADATPGAVVLVEAGANHWLALRDYLDGLAKRS